jgi:hypothetical protein
VRTGSKAVRKEAKHRSLRREMEVQIKAFGVVGTDVETSSQGSHDRVCRVTDGQTSVCGRSSSDTVQCCTGE